jgi:hypothetical protein
MKFEISNGTPAIEEPVVQVFLTRTDKGVMLKARRSGDFFDWDLIELTPQGVRFMQSLPEDLGFPLDDGDELSIIL